MTRANTPSPDAQNDSGQPRNVRGKREDYVTATRGRSGREREKGVVQVQSREELSERHAEGLHI